MSQTVQSLLSSQGKIVLVIDHLAVGSATSAEQLLQSLKQNVDPKYLSSVDVLANLNQRGFAFC